MVSVFRCTVPQVRARSLNAESRNTRSSGLTWGLPHFVEGEPGVRFRFAPARSLIVELLQAFDQVEIRESAYVSVDVSFGIWSNRDTADSVDPRRIGRH